MKRVISGLVLAALTGLLSGCYIAPGYSYVQGNGYAGDAYYGTGPSVVYSYPYYGYYPYGYGYGYGYYGCCYGPGVIVGGYWYGGHYYRGGGGWHGRGGWSGGHGGWSGGHGGWSGGHGASHGSSGGGHGGH
ncbi:hypothetical protein DWU99_19515 [Dyella psychrodurans]|uniref:Uncharacterized protein n=1 Tax=Dyella psychrodurans TaxID=1927960 RepID=A0A370WW63_9GAMM|nr:hypothetical protein DWU99_19515 [Dyella psychrodurans]